MTKRTLLRSNNNSHMYNNIDCIIILTILLTESLIKTKRSIFIVEIVLNFLRTGYLNPSSLVDGLKSPGKV